MIALHLDAGKYAAYLWPAYGISLVVLGALTVESLSAARRWRRRAEGTDGPDRKAEGDQQAERDQTSEHRE